MCLYGNCFFLLCRKQGLSFRGEAEEFQLLSHQRFFTSLRGALLIFLQYSPVGCKVCGKFSVVSFSFGYYRVLKKIDICARSSVGQSNGFLIRRPQVRVLPGVLYEPRNNCHSGLWQSVRSTDSEESSRAECVFPDLPCGYYSGRIITIRCQGINIIRRASERL